ADLPGKSPLLIGNKEKIATIQGKIALCTTQQIADITTGKVAEFFVHLFQRSDRQGNLYDITNYRVVHDKADWVYDPQFSPDGSKVLFKDGWPFDSHGTFKLYFLNIKTGKLHSGPSQMMSFPIVKWSPDGRYLLFTSGGGNQGEENNPYYPRTLYVFDTANNQ